MYPRSFFNYKISCPLYFRKTTFSFEEDNVIMIILVKILE